MADKVTKTARHANTEGETGAGKPAVPQTESETQPNSVDGAAGGGGGAATAAPISPIVDESPALADAAAPAKLGNDQGTADGAGDVGGPDPGAVNRFGMPRSIRVTGPEKGRRRAGMRFAREPVILQVSDLTDEAIAAIAADPELTVFPEEAAF